jgi:hypothetical protein
MTISVITVKMGIEQADETTILAYLTEVTTWDKKYNEPRERRQKETASAFLTEIQGYGAGADRNGAVARARRFLLHECAEQAGAQNGFLA